MRLAYFLPNFFRPLWRLALCALCALCTFPPAVQAQTTVTAFSPAGTVKGVRQATARFSDQMVPLGDMRLADPFAVDCPQPGKGRWIDGSNWSYDFERDLPAGVACRFTLKDDARDLAGKALAGERRFAFDTGGPAVVDMLPREGARIDEQQVFVLGLDAPASDATVAAHAWCRAEGVHEQIGVRILTGAQRQQVLDQRKAFTDRYLSLYFKARGVVVVMPVVAESVSVCAVSADSRSVRLNCPNLSVTLPGARSWVKV